MVDFDLRRGVRRWVWPGLQRSFAFVEPPAESGAPAAADPYTATLDAAVTQSYAQRLYALAEHEALDGVAIQSVLVAVLRALERVAERERGVAEAAISMGQRSKLAEMTATLSETIAALRTMLTEQGAAMLRLPAPSDAPRTSADDASWWFTLTESIQEIERAQACLASLTAGQPKGGAARQLGNVAIRLLRNHHHALLREAEQWMD